MFIPILLLTSASTALASSGYVKAGLGVVSSQRLSKRQATGPSSAGLILNSNQTAYYINTTIGTPPQPLLLHLDTGSADLVIVKTGTISCNGVGECPSGTFDPAHSSTFEVVSQDTFNASYLDGDGYYGDWVTDAVDVGGISLDAGLVYIGLADKLVSGSDHPNTGEGILGISYQTESQASALTSHNNTLPPTTLSAMVFSGAINRQAYSLFLGSAEAGEGSIVFGGVEPSLYTGDLVALQVLETPGSPTQYARLIVALTGVSISDGTGTRMLTPSDFAIPALIDSGTTNTKIPSSVLGSLVAGFGVTMNGGSGYLPCSRNASSATVGYHFGGDGGPVIDVPLSYLMSESDSNVFTDNEKACDFGIEGLEQDGHVILGDSFMRSGYFVFDLANNQIAMAQAAQASETGRVTAIPSGTDIPGCSSTNTFTAASTGDVGEENSSQIPTQTLGKDGNTVPATPTFDLSGSVASASASVTASATPSSGGSSSSSAVSATSFILGSLLLLYSFCMI